MIPKPVTSIKVLSDNKWVDLNHKFTFKVFDSNNKKLQEQAKLFVNNSEIERNKFQPNTYGAFGVVAKFQRILQANLLPLNLNNMLQILPKSFN